VAIKYNSNYHGTIPFSDVARQVALAANTSQAITIPGTATTSYQALFSYNQVANVFVSVNTTGTVPAGGTTGTEQYNEFRPWKRYVKGGDVLHLISPDAGGAYVGVSLRQLQGS
jgi:hypothetical protein